MENVKLTAVQAEEIAILKDFNSTLLEELAKWRAFAKEKTNGNPEL